MTEVTERPPKPVGWIVDAKLGGIRQRVGVFDSRDAAYHWLNTTRAFGYSIEPVWAPESFPARL